MFSHSLLFAAWRCTQSRLWENRYLNNFMDGGVKMIFLKHKKSQPLISKRLAQKKQTTFSVACSPYFCFLLFYGSSVPVSLENIRFTIHISWQKYHAPKTWKNPIKSGFFEDISFLHILYGGAGDVIVEPCSVQVLSALKASSISSNGMSSMLTGFLLALIISVKWSS